VHERQDIEGTGGLSSRCPSTVEYVFFVLFVTAQVQ